MARHDWTIEGKVNPIEEMPVLVHVLTQGGEHAWTIGKYSKGEWVIGDPVTKRKGAFWVSKYWAETVLEWIDLPSVDGRFSDISANEYQKAAERTISQPTAAAKESHALHGMVSEIGELHSIYQKTFQGHEFDETHAMKEVGDLLWFIAEYCTAMCWNLSDVMELNIEKLKKRYPRGFEESRSLNREEGDV